VTTSTAAAVRIRQLDEMDLDAVIRIDEQISGQYRPDVWDRRAAYYLRRDPEASLVAEVDGAVVGFIFGEVRSGEFGIEEPAGWIEVVGVDPTRRGLALGRRLAEGILDHFRRRGASKVRTLVDRDMAAGDPAAIEQFFRSLGFETAPIVSLVRSL
jgi:ribosomal protein S18 acetylase RimI-like enzyme